MLPFFVYGTLLPGQPNYALWRAAVVRVMAATLPGARLYDMGAFPLLLETSQPQDPPSTVRGAVVEVRADAYEAILRRLDALEQVNLDQPMQGPYRRVERVVQLDDGATRRAWAYVGNRWLRTTQPLIPDGDWARHSAETMATILDWWQAFDNTPFQPPAPE